MADKLTFPVKTNGEVVRFSEVNEYKLKFNNLVDFLTTLTQGGAQPLITFNGAAPTVEAGGSLLVALSATLMPFPITRLAVYEGAQLLHEQNFSGVNTHEYIIFNYTSPTQGAHLLSAKIELTQGIRDVPQLLVTVTPPPGITLTTPDTSFTQNASVNLRIQANTSRGLTSYEIYEIIGDSYSFLTTFNPPYLATQTDDTYEYVAILPAGTHQLVARFQDGMSMYSAYSAPLSITLVAPQAGITFTNYSTGYQVSGSGQQYTAVVTAFIQIDILATTTLYPIVRLEYTLASDAQSITYPAVYERDVYWRIYFGVPSDPGTFVLNVTGYDSQGNSYHAPPVTYTSYDPNSSYAVL